MRSSTGSRSRWPPAPAASSDDRAAQGRLGENWLLLAGDLARGSDLPLEVVLLDEPRRISFTGGEGGAGSVKLTFAGPGARFFLLRPLKEWRGLLEEARALLAPSPGDRGPAPFLEPCRLWSRACLAWPVRVRGGMAAPDPAGDGGGAGLLIADAYRFLEFQDPWRTAPLPIASLPALASYGLLVGHPGLRVVSEARRLGSWGVWGDHLAVPGDVIVYRIPLDPFPRYGGFTAYCFGPTDVGGPGSLAEVLDVKRSGANSFRPQSNDAGERTLRTAQWCRENGIQDVLNIDEKWIPDAVEHWRRLAKALKGSPPFAVAYDLLNEPETREPRAYCALVKKITAAIREEDRTHLIYVEAMPGAGPGGEAVPPGGVRDPRAHRRPPHRLQLP